MLNTMKHALLIGLTYANTPNELKGPARDLYRIRDTLVDYEVTLIIDALGSKQNIVQCFLDLVKKKGTLFFYFSGHGQENPEAIFCNDGTITHTEFRDMLTHLDPDANLVAVIDTCFSGNLFDLTYRWANEWVQQGPPAGHVSLISSSLSDETSLEYLTRNDAYGAFTRAYLHAIQDNPTWRSLMEHIASHLAQHPVLTSAEPFNVNQPFEI
jgi:hypothetical protein